MGTKYLLTGQSAPSNGEPQSIAFGRDACFTIYSSGQGSVQLQYESPFFQNQWVKFYEFDTLTTGYSVPAYLTTPMNKIRATCQGSGKFWAAVTYQN